MSTPACDICGKPRYVPRAEFRRWFKQEPPERFVPLREFLADYCLCEQEEVPDVDAGV